MPENDPAVGASVRSPNDREASEALRRLDERSKSYERLLALRKGFTFLVLAAASVGVPIIVFTVADAGQPVVLRIAINVILGILGLVAGVAYYKFSEERLERKDINEVRLYEKEFLDRLKRDLHSRLT